jgi:hypothetical protein
MVAQDAVRPIPLAGVPGKETSRLPHGDDFVDCWPPAIRFLRASAWARCRAAPMVAGLEEIAPQAEVAVEQRLLEQEYNIRRQGSEIQLY